MDLAWLLELIQQHGEVVYGFIFAYAASHALLMALFAGYAAQMGALDLGKTILLCWAGSFAGDLVRFWVARRYGERILSSFPRLSRGAGMVRRLVDRHGWWLPLVIRFPYGVRGIGGFAFGLSAMSWGGFLVLNFAGAGLWAVTTVGAGYAFGQVSDRVLGDAASRVALASLVLFLGVCWLLSRKLEQAMRTEAGGDR
jgi:membrane protein DedA with SNARE-associated domain